MASVSFLIKNCLNLRIRQIMSESDLYPIAVLIDELKHEDKKIRLNAMKSIQTIGKHPRSKLSKKNKK